MKKRVLSIIMAAMSVAMFGVLYPEYILLPDTYEYIADINPNQEQVVFDDGFAIEGITELLYEKPGNIRISSKVLQLLEEEGIVRWKNRD